MLDVVSFGAFSSLRNRKHKRKSMIGLNHAEVCYIQLNRFAYRNFGVVLLSTGTLHFKWKYRGKMKVGYFRITKNVKQKLGEKIKLLLEIILKN